MALETQMIKANNIESNNIESNKIIMNKILIKNFPPDVATIICSFGYPEYKEYMNEICYQLTHYTGHGLLAYNSYLLHEEYERLYDMNYVDCMQDFLNYLDDKVLENLFIQCTKCCCCSKHGHNRPSNYYTNDVSIGENFNTDEMCHCTCRSISRSIKRIQLESLQESLQSQLGTEIYDLKKRKCRRKSTFNDQFIHLAIHQSNRTPPLHARCHQVNQPVPL